MRRDALAWAAVAASAAGFAAVSVLVASGRLLGFDAGVLGWVDSVRTPWLTELMRSVTHLGDGWTLGLLSVVASCLLWRSGHRRATVFLLCVSAGAGLLDNGLKLAFARERPDLALRLARAAGFAFPSGHAMASAAVYAALARVAGGAARCWGRWLLPVLATVLVVGVGCSRVYLNVHFASDVVGGWLLGLGWYVLLGRLLLDRGHSRP
jgi:undecaprenyl-diphosphatase